MFSYTSIILNLLALPWVAPWPSPIITSSYDSLHKFGEWTPKHLYRSFPTVVSSSILPRALDDLRTPTAAPTTSGNTACAAVGASFTAATGSAPPQVPALLAWECIQSVPLNVSSGLKLMNSIRPYLDWQTTITYLKDPPPGYLEPAVDVLGEFASIVSKLQSSKFTNEYDFEFALYELFQTAHDEHFGYLPSLVAGLFGFGRPLALVSVSSHGDDLPKPYVYADLQLSIEDKSFTPSALSLIDGQRVEKYLESWAQLGSSQDPDALFNNMMYEPAQISLGIFGTGAGTFSGDGYGAYIYPGASTTLTFENGTNNTYENFARVLQNFTGINTGHDVYVRFLEKSTLPSTLNVTELIDSTPAAPGYPAPVIRQTNNFIGGYYLNATGYEDVAVLSVPSFAEALNISKGSFLQIANKFLTNASAAGKTKLVIDLSANGGGDVLQGYSLFENLFPNLDPYGGTRFRAHEAFDLMGEVISSTAGPVYPWNLSDPSKALLQAFIGTPFDYRSDIDATGRPFYSWAEKYGPHTFHGDNFTSIIRYNLSDNSISPFIPGASSPLPLQPLFAPKDIVLLTDGYCASTCTIFAELMTSQGGVKTIAVGGRPLPEKQMQAVGGTKGVNNYSWIEIWNLVNATRALIARNKSSDDCVPASAAAESLLGKYDTYWNTRGVLDSGSVNVRDGIAAGDEGETPLQFVYQPADCRIWYTKEMIMDVSVMWKRAADVAWGGAKCVVGKVN